MTLQTAPYAALAERWRRIEAMGFDSIWIADHSSSQYRYIAYEAWSLLGALAAVTTRVRFGPLVTPPTFRHPAVLAMQAVTVDHLSGGRLELGLGAGGGALDAGFIGQAAPGPGGLVDRFAEYVEILDRMLRGETLTFEGRHYRATGAAIVPPVQQPRPPFVIAAHGRRALQLVARYADTWNTMGGQPSLSAAADPVTLDQAVAATRSQITLLDAACEAIGRDPKTVRRSVLAYRAQVFGSTDAFEEYAGRYQELGFHECIVYSPTDWRTFAPLPEQEAVMERVAADVLPRFRADAAKT
jgi:alkanesulfonate monooxygenase SsuD/methylene tetrahydromethanopterin reductase-like flavin-dependent oxidoreductase (luciferase family)